MNTNDPRRQNKFESFTERAARTFRVCHSRLGRPLKREVIKSRMLCIVAVDEYFQQASCDDLGPEVTQKATGAHPFNTLRSHFSAVVCYRGKLEISSIKNKECRTDTECMRDTSMAMFHVTFRGCTAQRAQDNSTLFADPAILLRIIKPQLVSEFPEKVRVEIAHRLHLVVRHGQGGIDSRRCSQEVIQDRQLVSWPGGLQETKYAQGNGDEV